MGGLDSIVNNSGITIPKHISLITEEHFNSVMNTNFRSYFFCSQAALPYLRKLPDQSANVPCHGSSIINISSVHAKLGCPGHSLYAATKGAVVSMIKSVAVEFARYGIRANAVLPGWIATDMTERHQQNDRFVAKVLPRVPIRRWGEPDDFGGMAVYLASDASRYHTGTTNIIDGGYSVF